MPWALLGALVIVGAVEVGARRLDPMDWIPYEWKGPLWYTAVREHLEFIGPAEVAFMGSSRTREAFVVPLLRKEVPKAIGRPITIVNYGAPGCNADEAEAIVRVMARQPHPPKYLFYGITPYQLADLEYDVQGVPVWSLAHWWQRLREPNPHPEVFERWPFVVRNEIEDRYRTFAYREMIPLRVWEATTKFRLPSCPLKGEYSKHQQLTPKRSLVNTPQSAQHIKRYISSRLRRGKYVMGGPQMGALRRVMERCRAAGIQLILVELPQSEALRAQLPLDTMRRFYSLVAPLASEYDVPFLRVRQFGIDFGLAEFREMSHLNLAGARRFTSIMIRDVIVPAILGTPLGQPSPAVKLKIPPPPDEKPKRKRRRPRRDRPPRESTPTAGDEPDAEAEQPTPRAAASTHHIAQPRMDYLRCATTIRSALFSRTKGEHW
ncbi:MAG: hypothetical protein D6744_02460 [Planctomycetota bacterium]|nr:MAG: hypothetical protein D6744_02460 [Planctomycetota bacterium]